MSDMNKNEQRRKKTISCGAVPWRNKDGHSQILLIKPFGNRDVWGIAKGHIEDGESREMCAVREVKEETGIDVALGDPLPTVTTYNSKEQKDVYSFLATQLCSEEPKTLDPDEDIAAVQWFNINKLPPIHVYQRPIIDDVVHRLKVINDVVVGEGGYEEVLKFVHSYAADLDDWLLIKKELLKEFNSEQKSSFSLRDPITKKQRTNDFERALIVRWESLTGRKCILS